MNDQSEILFFSTGDFNSDISKQIRQSNFSLFPPNFVF